MFGFGVRGRMGLGVEVGENVGEIVGDLVGGCDSLGEVNGNCKRINNR